MKWEGNEDVTSQETCLFLSTKNFRDLKFIEPIVFQEFSCSWDILFVSIVFHFVLINNEI
ncbi:hypothetical protein ASG22_18150 [Chryseobacterium sp. Leaf405]|nr:hypothetical protein ASG22_18150 [Chryseobacterium sp. Leaf405]